MGNLGLLVLAIGPALCLVHVLWARDREREPLGNLFLYLGLGALSVVPAAVLEGLVGGGMSLARGGLGVLLLPLFAYVGVALMEEGPKRWFLLWRGARDRQVNEPFDWLVYGVAVGLGFATVENVLYVFQHGVGTGLVRAFTAVPAHGLFGTLMGWRLARAAQLTGLARARERRLSLLEPVLWHGTYDLFLFAANVALPGLFLTLFGVQLFLLWRVAVGRVAELARAQRHAPPPLLVLEGLAGRVRRGRAW